MKITGLKLILVMIFLFSPTGVDAANLLQNPGFDGDALGWGQYTDSSVVGEYSTEDAAGNPASGSASVTSTTSEGGSAVYGFWQCFPVTEGDRLRLGADLKIPTGQSTTGSSSLTVYYFSQPGCSSYISGDLVVSGSFGEWTGLSGFTLVPSGAQSATIYLMVNKQDAGGTLTALFDNVSAEPVLFWDGFETGDTSGWSSATP